MEQQLSYEDAEDLLVRFFYQRKFKEAIVLLEALLEEYPGKLHEIAWGLAYDYCLDGDHEKALDMFEHAQKNNVFLPEYQAYNLWEPLESFERFKGIKEVNLRMRDEAQATAKPVVEVLTPVDYSDNETYLLFIVLHGLADGNEIMMRRWTSETLSQRYIVAYMQSSQVVRTGGYGWDDVPLAEKEIKQMYESVVQQYPVDPAKTIIGGFSQGGQMALYVAFNRVIPVKGFSVLCPAGDIPLDLTEEKIADALTQGLKGTIITGDKDPSLKEQMDLATMLYDANFSLGFDVVAGEYHWFPANFGPHLDTAVADINKD